MANLRLSESNSSSLENCRARANYQNLILANKREVKSGSQMWHVYRLSENTKSDEFFFAQPIKALRYAFLLRKRSGAILPKAISIKWAAPHQYSSKLDIEFGLHHFSHKIDGGRERKQGTSRASRTAGERTRSRASTKLA